MSCCLTLKDVTVSYKVYTDSSVLFRTWLLNQFKLKRAYPSKQVVALNNVSLDLQEGDRVGLVGLNGAGKSTCLRTLAGIFKPVSGEIVQRGSLSTLFDLSLGMDDEATGYENIFIAGALLGLKRSELLELIDEIQAFTELGQNLYRPIKTYSTGMRVRLAFAIATITKREILLIDEIIGVGDVKFLKKASERIKDMIHVSKILVLASHAEFVLRDFCNKGVVLHQGKFVYQGTIDDAISYYNKNIAI